MQHEIDHVKEQDARDRIVARFHRRYAAWQDDSKGGLPTTYYTLNAGLAGSAYAFLRVYDVTLDPRAVMLANSIIDQTVDRLSTLSVPAGVEDISCTASLLHSPSGVWFTHALIKEAIGDHRRAAESVARFIDCASAPTTNFDITIGLSSVLIAIGVLSRRLRKLPPTMSTNLIRLGSQISERIHEFVASEAPSIRANALSLNFAHGWSGILYALLQAGVQYRAFDELLVRERLLQLADLAVPAPGGGLTWPSWAVSWGSATWCNGSAGNVWTWLAAHERFGLPAFLEVAEESAFHGGQRTNPRVQHICCGLAGQAFALLAVYRRTGDSGWLIRASELADCCAESLLMYPLTDPEAVEGLFKGEPGIVLLFEMMRNRDPAPLPVFAD